MLFALLRSGSSIMSQTTSDCDSQMRARAREAELELREQIMMWRQDQNIKSPVELDRIREGIAMLGNDGIQIERWMAPIDL
jgi:hypothetical protein